MALFSSETQSTSTAEPPVTSNETFTNSEAVRGAVNDVLSNHSQGGGQPKRGRGRPKGVKNSTRTESVRAEIPENTQPPSPPVDVESIKKTVAVVLDATDNYVKGKIGGLALRLTSDKDIAAGLQSSVAMSSLERDLIINTSGTVALKYEVLSRFMPEVILLVAVGSYGARVANAMRELKVMVAEQQAETKTKFQSNAVS